MIPNSDAAVSSDASAVRARHPCDGYPVVEAVSRLQLQLVDYIVQQ